MNSSRLVYLFAGIVLFTSYADGETLRPVIDPTGGFSGTTDWPVPTLVAFQFTPTSNDEYARALGAFDQGGNGLAAGHSVGLFDVASRQQLAAVLIPSGISAELVDGFRYLPISPVKLTAGRAYQVVALHSGPGMETLEERPSAISVNLASGLSQFRTLLDIRPLNNQLRVATDPAPVVVLVANLLIGPVPEPATTTLVGALGSLAVACCSRRR